MKKKYVYILFMLLSFLFINNVYASELNIIVPQFIDGEIEGDCVIYESGGKALLMDTCTQKAYANENYPDNGLKKVLKNRKIKELYVYISHYHSDHYGGLIELLKDDYFTIKRVYLPKTEYFCKGMAYAHKNILNADDETYFNGHYTRVKGIFDSLVKKNIPITFLWPENEPYGNESDKCFDDIKDLETTYKNKFSIGDMTIQIIGPVGNHSVTETATETTKYNDKKITVWREAHDNSENCYNGGTCYEAGNTVATKNAYITTIGGDYLNNTSLVAKIKVGKTTILSAGDIEIEEELALLDYYKNTNTLRSDIMKLSHHGGGSSNIEEFFKAVKPKYVFATALMAHPGHAGHNMFTTDNINRFDYLINGDGANASYRGANIYNAGYNGRIIIMIKDDFIRVRTQGTVLINENEETTAFTVNLDAYDEDNNLIERQKHDFTLDINSTKKDIPYKIYNHMIPFNGYFYVTDNIFIDINNVTEGSKTYMINYRKALKVTNTNFLTLSDDNLTIKAAAKSSKLECEENYRCKMLRENVSDYITTSDNLKYYKLDSDTGELSTNNRTYARSGDVIRVVNKDDSDTYIDYTFLLSGDPTGNGSIEKADAMVISNYIVNRTEPNYLSAGDMDDDGKVKINDVTKILRLATKGK